jgi:hypothetical protein
MTKGRLRRSRQVLAVAGGALLGVLGSVACGPPPIGWQGAGRIQTLPAPEGDAGGPPAAGDSGDGSPGADPVPPTDFDSGDPGDGVTDAGDAG